MSAGQMHQACAKEIMLGTVHLAGSKLLGTMRRGALRLHRIWVVTTRLPSMASRFRISKTGSRCVECSGHVETGALAKRTSRIPVQLIGFLLILGSLA